MKLLPIASTLSAAVFVTAYPVSFATEVGMASNFGQGDYYGRLDLEGYPPPSVIFRQPIAVERTVLGKDQRKPIYLRVRPNHAQHWRSHCDEYAACSELILFVRDSWYKREYVPRYRKNHPDQQEEKPGQRNEDRRVQFESDHYDESIVHLNASAISP